MASNFWAPALLASFSRHAPALKFRKANTTDDKSWLGAKGGKENCLIEAEHTPITTGMQPASSPDQETEIKVSAQMFPWQMNLDYTFSGHTAEKNGRGTTDCQPHAP